MLATPPMPRTRRRTIWTTTMAAGTAKADVIDPIKTESLNILEDMIEQTRVTRS